MASGPTVLNVVPEFGIPIQIEVDNMGNVRVSGAKTILTEWPFAKSKREIGGFVFANDGVDLKRVNGKLAVCLSRSMRRGGLTVAVDSNDGQSYNKSRLEIQGDKEGLHIAAVRPENLERPSVHLADIKI